MDERIADELERVGKVHELLRMLREAERAPAAPRARLPAEGAQD